MAQTAEGLIERIAALRPMLEANATKTENDRRVVEENITALRDAGAFKVPVPKRFGGYEGNVRLAIETSREVAMGCGSTGWVTALQNVCAFFTAVMNEQAQNDVWGLNPDTRIAGVLTPTSTSRKVDGGYIVNGAWSWASGSYHADWSYVGVPIVDENGDFTFPATVLIPNSDITIEETWFTSGMKGTGSNTLHAKDVFVPDHRVQPIPGLLTHNYDTPFKNEVPYRSSFMPVAEIVLAGPQLGLAQAALDYVIEKGHKRGIAYTEWEVQRDAPTFQMLIAKGATLVEQAHLFAYKAADDIDAAAVEDRPMTYLERARIRNMVGYSIESSREAIRTLCSAHGASSFAENSPMQRISRDSEIASRHAVIVPETASIIYGRALMGFTDGISVLV
jgi:3-hydroxy-9,10-secoandrosta-1,3,5(10)-triene-9,17-dione monooxygenase